MSINEKYEEISEYCQNIKDSKKLTSEEEKEIGEKIRNGDVEALNILVTSNLKYVVSVVKSRFSWCNLPMYDLISEGNVGLIKAAKKFDPSIGTKFITYADRWIRQSIKEYIEKCNVTTEHISVDEIVNKCNNGISDDELGCDDSENTYVNTNRCDAVNELIGTLNKREREILEHYFGLNGTKQQTLDEIGQDMGLTQERVRQIKDESIEKLQFKAMSNDSYAEFKDL